MFMIILLSSLCCFMNHPLTLGFILLLQTILIALLTGFMNFSFWSSYIIFLIMIGGMLILFIYMTSVASNEKFKFSFKLMYYLIFMVTMTFPLNLSDKFFTVQKLKTSETFAMNEYMNSQFFINKFINFPNNLIYLMMVIYLLVTLVAIVKISNKTKSAMRSNF
uniref:NADH-ubiquinone oxidoreductase chain 6 n=1 Tax=Chrysomelidae sp. SOIL MMG Contig15 TaxID=2834637 RepID=A0A8F4WCR4_9CUCU|nr:NADH dehydrogenase subunit 6 [Chrysomelidae sp. SOIL MMG Contig15]